MFEENAASAAQSSFSTAQMIVVLTNEAQVSSAGLAVGAGDGESSEGELGGC